MKRITLAEGAGGKAMQRLISEVIIKGISKKSIPGGIGLRELDDSGVIPLGKKNLVLTTDAHTISPIFFRGGDIGKLSICGTINDLAVMGAKPLALTASIVMEEGFPVNDLKKIISSMNSQLEKEGTALISGDTKVMEKGALDKIVITTAGIGIAKKVILDSGLRAGDKIILSGGIAEHGFSILSQREGIEFTSKLKSDCASLWPLVKKALKVGGITAMKDPTRGGLSTALNEFAKKSNTGIVIHEEKIPIKKEVRAASEMLGIDPLTMTNEGKIIMGVDKKKAEKVLKEIKKESIGKKAAIIGEVTKENRGKVILETLIGGRRILDTPLGDPIPRIC